MPKAPTSTQPLQPPARASASVFPWRNCSSTTLSALKMEGKPYPFLTTRRVCFKKASGDFLESWMLLEGCRRCISSMMSKRRCDTSLEPSEPSGSRPPRLMLAKSV